MVNEMPQIIKKVGFDFHWSESKVWALAVPTEERDITELAWHLDIPFLWWDGGVYNLKPSEVIMSPKKYQKEYDRAMKADTIHPIDIMQWRGRWVILDGLHRLMKQTIEGKTKVMVRKIDPKYIPDIIE